MIYKLVKLVSLIYEYLSRRRRAGIAVRVLSCLMVFIVTYMLILPAFTLDRNEAADQGGIDVSETVSDDTEVAVPSDGSEMSVEIDENTRSEADVRDKDKEVSDTVTDNPAVDHRNDKSDNVDADTEIIAEEITSVDDHKLTYEDGRIKVTASAIDEDALPDEATLNVKEIVPDDAENADAYARALTTLSNTLREKNSSFSAVKVYDFTIYDNEGNELEPDGEVEVKIEYKKRPDLGDNDGNEADIQIAHLVEDDSEEEGLAVEFVDADIDASSKGIVTSAEFTTESFSAYVVFNKDGISDREPTDLGSYGWIKFHTVGQQDTTQDQTADPDSTTVQWGYYKSDGSNLPSPNTPWAYRRILKVRLWLPKGGETPSMYDSNHYNESATVQYFWVWQNEVNIEEFELPGYEVVHTRMHTAWDEENGKKPVDNDSLIGSYAVRGYRSSTISNETGTKNSDLNVLDIYANPLQQTPGMNYIIRYVHADGSVTDGNVRSLSSGSITYDASKYQRTGEEYAGTSIITGSEAVNANTTVGTGTITYNANVSLAKVYVYYKEKIEGNGNTSAKGRYDKDEKGYYTGERGLYTDKSAEAIPGKDRQFILNLESWYVDNAASVGMVLDASGSMAWTSGEPEPIVLTNEQVEKVRQANGMTKDWWGVWSGNSDIYFNGGNNDDAGYPPMTGEYITNLNALSLILDKTKTDNSAMGYNGYHYYLKDMRSTVREYVALGYSDGNQSTSETLGGNTIYTTKVGNTSYSATVVANRFIKDENNAHGKNEGWYYVNSTGNTKAYLKYTGKSYDGYSSKGNKEYSNGKQNLQGGPLRFYIKKGTNELWVSYYNGSGDGEIRQSPVYEKREKMFTKMETLQDAVSQFGAIVLGSSPESQIGITRFSQQVKTKTNDNDQWFNNTSYLPLLNWTSSTQELSSAMNLSKNAKGSTNRSDDGLTVYEYGLTGQTRTWTGVQAYSDYLKENATAANHKYLVIFTDGRDTNKDDEKTTGNPPWGETGKLIQTLKNDGYTIITVMMRSQAMVGNEYTSAKAFLQGIASPGLDGNTSNTAADNKLYFEADSNSTKDVIDAFRQIAGRIASGLNGYTVRDYIDPRFDVLNDAGDILTTLDGNGQFIHATNSDVDEKTGLRAFTTPDNRQAYLGYDTEKKMFYVLWKNQEIPASTLKSKNVNPWKSQIRIQAKEDFLGGNDILSNGNETGLNQVYYPDSSDPIGLTPVRNNANYPSKDFPKTTTNPGTLSIKLSNYEDTIFLGENISPASIYESVQAKRDSEEDSRSLYFSYLERAGKKLKNDTTYYVNLLKYGTVPANTDPSKDVNGKDIVGFKLEKDVNGVTSMTMPYYYLENPNDGASYAGGTLHQADKVGTVTYSWKAITTGQHTLTDNNALKDYESTTLDTVRYQLSVSYKADEFDSTRIIDSSGHIAGDSIDDNGSVRTQTLTNQKGTGNLIKDPVGTPVQEQSTNKDSQGLAAIHVVAGKFRIIKQIEITQEKWNELIQNADNKALQFTFQLKKDGKEYGDPITISTKTASTSFNGGYIELVSEWLENLPKGNYTIEEITQPEGFSFKSVSVAAVTADDADSKRLGGIPFAAPTSGTNTWMIGSVSGGVPTTTTYSPTDFSATKVKDEKKEYDPDKSKAYLNAQIGKGIIINEPPRTIDVTLKKVDKSDLDKDNAETLKGASFTITKYTDNTFRVQDTSASAWSSVKEDKLSGNSYTLNGIFKFKGLPAGFYVVDETVMPAGYIKTGDDPAFEVRQKTGAPNELEVVLYQKKSDGTYEEASTGSAVMVRLASDNTLIVGNEPGVALPSTGGSGTRLFTILGLILTTGAGLLLWRRRSSLLSSRSPQ